MANVQRVIPTPLGHSVAKVVRGSTIFEDAQSCYLTRTPGTAGNTRSNTRSYWIKFTQPDDDYDVTVITGGGSDGNNRWHSGLAANKKFYKYERIGGSDKLDVVTDGACYRDYGCWYHFVEVTDTTNGTGSDRYRFYVNGERVTLSFSVEYSQDQETLTNAATPNNIGARYGASNDELCAQMCEHHLLDGLVVGPEYFGYTDPNTGSWRPKTFDIKSIASNDGSTWSSSGAVTGVSGWTQALANGFNGSISDAAEGNTYGETATISLGKTVTISAGGVGVFTWVTSGQPLVFELKLGGVVKETVNQGSSGGQWYRSSSYAGDIDTITIARTSRAPEWGAISINGQILTDGVGEWGVNGFYLPLDGTGYSAFDTIGNMVEDQSTNQNNHTSNGAPRFSLDSPSGVPNSIDTTAGISTFPFSSNYAVWNYSDKGDTVTVSEGGIRQESSTYSTSLVKSTFGMTAGKYYFEYRHTQKPSGGWSYIGVMDEMARTHGSNASDDLNYKYDKAWSYNSNGSVTHDDDDTAYGDSWSNGDVIGCAFDVDQGKIWFSKNVVYR